MNPNTAARPAAGRFRYSALDRRCSLVLTRNFHVDLGGRAGSRQMVEMSLSPRYSWEGASDAAIAEITALTLRIHRMPVDAKDVFTDELLPEDEIALHAHLGADLTAWLLDPATEILGLVNWKKHERFSVNGGGVSLRLSAWGQHAHLIPETRPSASVGRAYAGLLDGTIAASSVTTLR